MPSLSTYSAELDYAYAPGMFPAMECLLHRPESCRRVLLHSRSAGTEGAQRLREEAEKHHIRVEEADKALSRISGKENCFAAAVFSKFEDDLRPDKPHIVLHHPSDSGNVGTIFRTALGFDVQDIAVIRPCMDVLDPKTVRASMGSIFSCGCMSMMIFRSIRRSSRNTRSIRSCWTGRSPCRMCWATFLTAGR